MSLRDALNRNRRKSEEIAAAAEVVQARERSQQQAGLSARQQLDRIIDPCAEAICKAQRQHFDSLIAMHRKELKKMSGSQCKSLDSVAFPGTTCVSYIELHGSWGSGGVNGGKIPQMELYLRNYGSDKSCSIRLFVNRENCGNWDSLSCTFGGSGVNSVDYRSFSDSSGSDGDPFRYLLEALPECFAAYMDYFGIPFPEL